MEPFCIMVVAEAAAIAGRSLLLIPVQPMPTWPDKIRVGDHLELRRPDGSTHATTITGFNSFRPRGGTQVWPRVNVPAIPASITKAEVPDGTEVWWISRPATTTTP